MQFAYLYTKECTLLIFYTHVHAKCMKLLDKKILFSCLLRSLMHSPHKHAAKLIHSRCHLAIASIFIHNSIHFISYNCKICIIQKKSHCLCAPCGSSFSIFFHYHRVYIQHISDLWTSAKNISLVANSSIDISRVVQ